MRVIIEVDNEQELASALEALKAFKDQPIQVRAPRRGPSPRERQAILERIYDRYQIDLPANWRFDRDEANER